MQVLGLASSKVYDGVIQALPAKRAAYGSPNHKAADSTCGQTTSISKLCLSPKQQHAQPKPQDIYTWMVSPPLMRNLKSGAVSQGGVTEMPLAKALRAVLDNHLRSLTKGKVKDERPLKQVFEAYINAFGGALAECGAACMGMPASAPTPTTLNHATRASSDAVATITADAMDCTPESAPGAAAATDSSIDGTNNSVSVSAAAALAAGEVDLRALSTSMLLSASLPPALDATIEVLRWLDMLPKNGAPGAVGGYTCTTQLQDALKLQLKQLRADAATHNPQQSLHSSSAELDQALASYTQQMKWTVAAVQGVVAEAGVMLQGSAAQLEAQLSDGDYLLATLGPMTLLGIQDEFAEEAKRKKGKLPDAATALLRAWFDEHISHAYPSDAEKAKFMDQTGLDLIQINNWFTNMRKRHTPEKEEARAAAKSQTVVGGGGGNGAARRRQVGVGAAGGKKGGKKCKGKGSDMEESDSEEEEGSEYTA